MRIIAVAVFAFILHSAIIVAQDPAEGWLGYAKATYPQGIITYIEAKWRVPDDPADGGAFFSPWFGIEASDNLNLIQPVNPWVGEYKMLNVSSDRGSLGNL